ncbi:MAG TPA: CRISPR-associated endonuclease Cas3'' [Roseiflexaceae bacterium]|nr:CRISPR-associated endonuclease Cas3'' [Roseiflexaceae bacterium]HMP40548.1 CRISPR-associated endonuclease Cas3'' [Roseiflexaceae bacterium]
MKTLYAHTPAMGSTTWHLLLDHLIAVAETARGFADSWGAGEIAYYLGLWHDIGKANPAFQNYLLRCYADANAKGTGPDHKAAGASIAHKHMPPLALLVQGHHGGLKSRSEFIQWYQERQSDKIDDTNSSAIQVAVERVRELISEIDPAQPLGLPAFTNNPYSAEFFLRMLFSTLVDADYLDTEQHGNEERAQQRGSSVSFAQLLARFEADQARLTGRRDDAVGKARHSIYESCLTAAQQPPGLFRLAVPTGGGKTRSAMAFALHHALQHNLRQVIVAVPFISITEQTASVYRELFETEDGSSVVLEHHSGSAPQLEVTDYDPSRVWSRLAAENWDAPIVVTTTVQLFESMFASQTGRCRKLHRLAKSVIILDESQVLPSHVLTPILDGLRELCRHYGATVVLSTATQPAFESVKAFADLPATDIVPNAAYWFGALKRVTYDWRTDQPMQWEEVAEILRTETQALAIVNAKPDALDLLDALDDSDALHLSTMLCGAHRRDVIGRVKEQLRIGASCRLVSTQVIEAGVDLDFPLVLRAMGPLDSIIQAAGRCNREGLLTQGRVIVFTPAAGRLPSGAYRTATDITQSLLTESFDPDDPKDVQRYFHRLFATVDLDREQVQKARSTWNYTETARRFRMIDEDMEDVIITAYGSSKTQKSIQVAIEQLRTKAGRARYILRRLQPYLVSIRTRNAKRFRQNGLIEDLIPGVGIWHGQYDAVRGLVADDDRSLLVF